MDRWANTTWKILSDPIVDECHLQRRKITSYPKIHRSAGWCQCHPIISKTLSPMKRRLPYSLVAFSASFSVSVTDTQDKVLIAMTRSEEAHRVARSCADAIRQVLSCAGVHSCHFHFCPELLPAVFLYQPGKAMMIMTTNYRVKKYSYLCKYNS